MNYTLPKAQVCKKPPVNVRWHRFIVRLDQAPSANTFCNLFHCEEFHPKSCPESYSEFHSPLTLL